MSDDDYWDCPCCERPMPPENDRECHCGIRISHHLSVSTLCKHLRNAHERECSLIVANKKLESEVNEQARLLGMSAERECDLRGELQRERALADRLAEALKELLYYDLQDVNLGRLKSSRDALAAWKEVRFE